MCFLYGCFAAMKSTPITGSKLHFDAGNGRAKWRCPQPVKAVHAEGNAPRDSYLGLLTYHSGSGRKRVENSRENGNVGGRGEAADDSR